MNTKTSHLTMETITVRLMALTFLRVVLGFILIWKGFNFINDTQLAKSLIEQTGIGLFSRSADVLTFIVAYLSLFCGVCIAVGLFTRVAAIIQIPILIVAILFVQIRNIPENNTFELLLAIVAFILLILFAISGSGMLSADRYFKRIKRKTEEA